MLSAEGGRVPSEGVMLHLEGSIMPSEQCGQIQKFRGKAPQTEIIMTSPKMNNYILTTFLSLLAGRKISKFSLLSLRSV